MAPLVLTCMAQGVGRGLWLRNVILLSTGSLFLHSGISPRVSQYPKGEALPPGVPGAGGEVRGGGRVTSLPLHSQGGLGLSRGPCGVLNHDKRSPAGVFRFPSCPFYQPLLLCPASPTYCIPDPSYQIGSNGEL